MHVSIIYKKTIVSFPQETPLSLRDKGVVSCLRCRCIYAIHRRTCHGYTMETKHCLCRLVAICLHVHSISVGSIYYTYRTKFPKYSYGVKRNFTLVSIYLCCFPSNFPNWSKINETSWVVQSELAWHAAQKLHSPYELIRTINSKNVSRNNIIVDPDRRRKGEVWGICPHRCHL